MSEESDDDRVGGERSDADRSDDRWGSDRSADDQRDGDQSVGDRWGEDADAVDPDGRGSDGDATGSAAPEDDEYDPSVAGVFGARPEDAPPRPEIVPESPDLENALFVLLGVLFGLFVIYRAVVVFTA